MKRTKKGLKITSEEVEKIKSAMFEQRLETSQLAKEMDMASYQTIKKKLEGITSFQDEELMRLYSILIGSRHLNFVREYFQRKNLQLPSRAELYREVALEKLDTRLRGDLKSLLDCAGSIPFYLEENDRSTFYDQFNVFIRGAERFLRKYSERITDNAIDYHHDIVGNHSEDKILKLKNSK